ncbi:hypothetical protein ACFYU5_18950 [Nocardia aobensis]|uniref:Uncharacterized protein n=1 Tax=Nocardia aobensis TaxID=257277 RepID=A0ABW6P5S6_9NOCA
MTPEEILNQAADLIEAAPKLSKGAYSAYEAELDDRGYESGLHVRWDETDENKECFCTMGAIYRVLKISPINNSRSVAKADLLHAIRKAIGFGDLTLAEIEGCIYGWNDSAERTKDEVVQTLRVASILAREVS